MARRLDDHLVGADAVHLVEESLALAVERAFDAQHGELVGHDAQAPAGPVRRAAVAMRQQLVRRHVLVPLTEGTAVIGCDGDRLEAEIGGGPWPFRWEDGPAGR